LGDALRIRAGFGAAFALLLGVGVAAVFQTYAWEASGAWVAHTFEVIGRLNDLSGFLKAGDFTRALPLAHDLQRLTTDNPAEAKNAQSALHVIAACDTAQPFVENDGAAPWFCDAPAAAARASGIVATMLATEHELLDFRMQKQRDIARRARRLFETASLLSLLLTFLAAWRSSGEGRKRTAAERAMAEREEQYRKVVEMAGDLIFRADQFGKFTYCNQTALNVLHLSQRELIGRSWLKLVRADKRGPAQRFYARQLARRKKNTYYEFPIVDGHGRERWIGQNVQLLIDEGRLVGFQGIAREITERKLAEQELQKSRGFVERIAATTPGILYVYDLDERRTVYSNREVISVLGYEPEEVQDDFDWAARHLHPDDLPAVRRHYEALRGAHDGEVRRIEYRARHSAGHWVWLSSRDTPFERDGNGTVKRIVGIAQDITAPKAAQDKLAYQANYDALTGLANRHHFRTLLQGVLRRAGIERTSASLCILDVDHFKSANDRFGHSAGDEVLEAVGSIIRSELRSSDFAGRLGGDEFCFVLPETDPDEAARLAERIRERLSTIAFGMASEGVPFTVTATFGGAEWRPHMESKDLLEAADRALYRAKSAGRNRVCVDI